MEKRIHGMAVYEHGNPKNQPVVLIHGFPLSAGMWQHQVQALAEQYYCVTYDLRGLGKTPPGDGQFTIEMFADDLFRVMDALKLNQPVVAGFSMGGYITLRAFEREPGRFRGLMLCDTRSEPDNDAGRLKRADAVKTINANGLEAFAAGLLPALFAEGAAQRIPEIYQKHLTQAGQQDPVGVKGCLLAMAARTDTTPSLSGIRVPTLLLVGEQDGLTPPPVMQAMADAIAGSRLAVISGAGHMAPVENPDAVTREMLSFLRANF